MSGKDVYLRRLERLKSSQETLLRLFAELDARFEPFHQLTEDYGSRIRKNGVKYIAWYVKRWLRCFIGMKDEVMVLISGEVIRKYHETGVHKAFIHDRGAENSIYRRSSILSLCSVDGIDYEYRMMVEKYGEKMALTRILDIHEPLGEKLNRLSKKIDDLVRVIHDAVQSFAPSKCQFDILHPAEKFLIILNENPVINDKGARFRNCSQIEALSTIIDDPNDLVSATVAVPKASTKRSRSAFNFEDDEDDETAQKLTKEAKKVPDFHMDVSLDQIKRAAGVSADLLAKPTTADFLMRDEVDMDMTNDPELIEEDKSALNSSAEVERVMFHRFGLLGTNPNFYSLPNGIGLYSKRVIRFKIITDDTHTSSTGSVTASAGSSFHSNSLQTQQFLEKIVPIVVTAHDVLLDIKDRGKLCPVLSASDILDEITAYLWYGLSPDRDETVKHIPREERPHHSDMFHPYLPVALQMEGTIFIAGEYIPLPAEDKPKKYPVTCDFCPAVTSLLQCLQQWIFGSTDRSTVTAVLINERRKKQDLLVANMSCIRYVAQKLRHLFQLAQQQTHEEDISAKKSSDILPQLVELDSMKITLSAASYNGSSLEEWYQWQTLLREATTIIFQSFSLYAYRCVYTHHATLATATNVGSIASVPLPFQFFPYVKCSSLSVSSLALSSDEHNSNWTLHSLNLSEDLVLFQYFRFPYSDHIQRWRKILLTVLPPYVFEGDISLTVVSHRDAIVSRFLDVSYNADNETTLTSSHRGSIASLFWKQLFNSMYLSSLDEDVRSLILLDPWIRFCLHTGRCCQTLQHIILPYSLSTQILTSPLSSQKKTRFSELPLLTIVVLFLGLAVCLEAQKAKYIGQENKPPLQIHLTEQMLRNFPGELPIATEYLQSQFSHVQFVYSASGSSKKDVSTAASLSIPIPDL